MANISTSDLFVSSFFDSTLDSHTALFDKTQYKQAVKHVQENKTNSVLASSLIAAYFAGKWVCCVAVWEKLPFRAKPGVIVVGYIDTQCGIYMGAWPDHLQYKEHLARAEKLGLFQDNAAVKLALAQMATRPCVSQSLVESMIVKALERDN
jgi:hypothetical protein